MPDKQEKSAAKAVLARTSPVIVFQKKLGETPLAALERARIEYGIAVDVPMTYAGRLDPMAEGVLLLLVGEECKKKGEYLGLDKEYEVEIVFGISTDTYDMLGLAEAPDGRNGSYMHTAKIEQLMAVDFQKYVGKFSQPYPAFSSKTVGGVQLHTLARAGELPDENEMPSKDVEIYSIEVVDEKTKNMDGVKGVAQGISAEKLRERIMSGIELVKGDFRQEEIIKQWDSVFRTVEFGGSQFKCPNFRIVRIRVKCSSGTYMRSLAERIGRELGVGGFALSIKRLSVGSFRL
ncbi:MAG: tRNA pseudouridine synthase tRNA pseudouridine55 synthase [Candidatus Parcubacteria bacterium]|jgi:tRNA pseudouridine(55) synthase